MSKFIPQKTSNSKFLWTDYFSNKINPKENREELERLEIENQKLIDIKNKIEAISLDKLSFRDLYEFPFHQAKYGSWVYDKNFNFIFEFENYNVETEENCLKILNSEEIERKPLKFKFTTKNDNCIYYGENTDTPFITIRGWGNLTGTGSYNFSGEIASKIQDTLLQYILETLNNQ